MGIRWLLPSLAPPARSVDEVALLAEAAALVRRTPWEALDRDALARLCRERGVDLATGAAFEAIRASGPSAGFVRELESLRGDGEGLPRLGGRLAVVPAAFYRSFPSVGGDGALVREVAGRLGLATSVVPLPDAGTLEENAALVVKALSEEGAGPLVVASLSKGGADVRAALESRPDLAASIGAWVNFCGLVRGTPLADDLLGARGAGGLVARVVLARHGASRRLLEGLSARPGARLAPAWLPPGGLLVVNVVGTPLVSHLHGTTAARHARLAPEGPNDGSTVLRDAVVEPGLVYPVWGADHYLRVPGSAGLLYRLFRWLHARGVLPASP